jgi:hypothetical protein
MSLPRGVLAVCVTSLAACATAQSGGDDIVAIDARNVTIDAPIGSIDAPPGTIDAPPGTIDAPTTPIDARIDAPTTPIDAPPTTQTITLSQSSSTTITSLNSVACSDTTFGYTRENSFYRVFRLTDFGVNTAFTANRVDVAVEEATAGIGSTQPIQVRLYTLTGTFILPNLTAIAGQTVTVPNSASLTVMQVTLSPPGVAAAGSTIVAEILSPDGSAAGNVFYPGSNASAETGPSYIRAPDCGAAQPATFASLSQPQVHLVLTVTGTY